MTVIDFVLAAADSVSIEAILVKVLTSTGGTGLAVFALYIFYKMWQGRQDKKVKNAADDPKPAITPSSGLPILGGVNPAGVERSGVVLAPEKQPVSNEICQARQRIITTKIDAVGEQVGKLDKSLADTNNELRKTTASLTEGVSKIETCVAVLQDRANRDG